MSRRSASPQGGSLVGEYPFLARFPFPKHLVLERGLLADDEEYPAGQQAGEEPEIVVAAVRHHDIAGLQAPAENLRLGGIVLPRASEDDEDGQQVPQAQRDMGRDFPNPFPRLSRCAFSLQYVLRMISGSRVRFALENVFRAGASVRPFVPGTYRFSRMVFADASDAPANAALAMVETLPTAYSVTVSGVNAPSGQPSTISGVPYRCSFDATLATGDAAELLAIEQLARDLTWVSTTIDSADRLVWTSSERIVGAARHTADYTTAAAVSLDAFRPVGVSHLFVASAMADVSDSIAAAFHNPGTAMLFGDRVGTAAAADAAVRGAFPEMADLRIAGAAASGTVLAGLDVAEQAGGFPSKPVVGAVAEEADSLPILADVDVLVVGAGTAGGPAAIAAARAGASTLVVELLHKAGGVMTDGRIGKYYYGNNVGFSKNEVDPGWKSKGAVLYAAKSEWFRAKAREEGAAVWYGVLANGALVGTDGDAPVVKGAVVVLPDGTRGVVRAKAVVDSTGNCEIVQAAGGATEYINASELAVQGAGWARQALGNSYQNTDIGFEDDQDPTDLTYFFRRALVSAGSSSWDFGDNPASRERHRIRGEYTVTPVDILCNRTYPDTIVRGSSNFDSHGYTTSDLFYLMDPGSAAHTANLPYRALVPEVVEGVLSTGLGISAHRDSMPMLRMQPDVQNEGYAAGYAAAMVASAGIHVRNIDVTTLQAHLKSIGILPSNYTDFTDFFPLPASEIEAAIAGLNISYAGLPKILSAVGTAQEETVRASLRAELSDTSASAAHRTACVAVLGLLRDTEGAAAASEVLAAVLDASPTYDTGWNYRGMGQYGRSISEFDGYILAGSRLLQEAFLDAVFHKSTLISNETLLSHIRIAAAAYENYGGPCAADELSQILAWSGNNAFARDAAPRAISGYSDSEADKERTAALKDIFTATALYRIGDDINDSGERILRALADDPRGVYAHYARLVLAETAPVDPEQGAAGSWICTAASGLWETSSNWADGTFPVSLAEFSNTPTGVAESAAQTVGLGGLRVGVTDLAVSACDRDFQNGTVRFLGDAPTLTVDSSATTSFDGLEAPESLTFQGGGTAIVTGPADLGDLVLDGGTFLLEAEECASVGSIVAMHAATFGTDGDLDVESLHGRLRKTGEGTVSLSLVRPEGSESDEALLSGSLSVDEGSVALTAPSAETFGRIPYPGFEPLTSITSGNKDKRDKRGSAANDCPGWTFVNHDRFAGYQGNGSYFSGNDATVAPEGTHTAFIGCKGEMSCTFEIDLLGTYELSFLGNRRYCDNKWYGSEPIRIEIDGTVVGSLTVSAQTWTRYSVEVTGLAVGTHTLRIVGEGAKADNDPCVLIDDMKLVASTQIESGVVNPKTVISVATGAELCLNYDGEVRIARLTLGGRTLGPGVYGASTDPDYLTGVSLLRVAPLETVLILF